MKPLLEKQLQAKELRKNGYSLHEISDLLQISKSSASIWVRDVQLNSQAKERIKHNSRIGQEKYLLFVKRRREERDLYYLKHAEHTLSQIVFNKSTKKLMCALLYWAEGGKKRTTSLRFINSDPKMIKVFLDCLRSSFFIDEHKLRGLVHIHEYHNESEVLSFWSRVTDIPLNKFSRSYIKPHTGNRKREEYMECMTIYYFDMKIAHELQMLYNTVSQEL